MQKSNQKLIIIVLCGIIVITLSAIFYLGSQYYFLNQQLAANRKSNLTTGTNNSKPTASPTLAVSGAPVTPALTSTQTAKNTDTKTFSNQYFSVSYPKNYVVDDLGNGSLKIHFPGPTQKDGTEFYDGVLIELEVRELPGTAQEQAQNLADGMSANMAVDEISEIKAINLGQNLAYTFTAKDAFTYTKYCIGFDLASHMMLFITDYSQDPKNMGFQQEVRKILESIEFKK